MDETAAQFFVSVGRLCTEASMAKLTVRVRLAGGAELEGVPRVPVHTEGVREFDHTGYADELCVAGVLVALSDVVAVTLRHPLPRAPSTP